MTTNKTMFRFNTRVVEYDSSGYYMTRWDSAQPVTVVAHTRDEAFKKVRAMMGKPARHDAWAVHMDSAEEIIDDNQ